MKAATTVQPGEVPCPDPSVHDHHNQLSEQASTAALLATHPQRNASKKEDPLGPDGKLSSRSAAASLKYARAQDLPSFPSVGIDTSGSAGKAAMLAKDYKMKELWQPELSSAGSKAALIAAKDGGKLDLWQPSASKEGNSAATLAMRNKGLSPQLDYGYTADGKSRALQAANLSIHRTRSGSTPTPATNPAYPDSQNSAYNALNAATVSHRAGSVRSAAAPDGWDSDAMQAARIKNLNKKIDPEMFTEHPPWKDEEEDKHQAALRASAVSMAKQMYEYKNRTVLGSDLTGQEGAQAAAARQPPSSQTDIKQEALRYIHLQDAAHKLAQERLAKIDKQGEDARYREYYGYPDEKLESSPRKSLNRLSLRSRGRPRATSEGADPDDSDDEEQARRIRTQMSQLGNNLSNVDEKKRADDRAKLLAAAEKRVHDRMHDMDEKVFNDTGKVPPAMMEEWEAKARQKAQEDKEAQIQHPGQTHIGGGKWISTAEIEAIAAARLKPTLDEINETAEKKRARDEQIRLQREEIETQKIHDKQQKLADKEEQKRVKDEQKAIAKKEKEEAEMRRREEKARREEEKRLAKEEQRKSREVKRHEAPEVGAAAAGGVAAAEVADEDREREEPEEPLAHKPEEPEEQLAQEPVRPEEKLAQEPEEKATGKRTGTLGRWASKLRRNKKPEEEKEAEEKTKSERNTDIAGVTAVGGAAGVAGAAAAEHHDEHDGQVDDEEPGDLDDDEDEFVGPREATVVPAVVVPVESTTENVPTSGGVLRPDLERHVSAIQDSDDEDGDDDELYEDEYDTLGGGQAHQTAARVLSASETDEWDDADDDEVVPTTTADRAAEKAPEEDEHHYGRDAAIAGGAGVAGVAAYDAATDDKAASAPVTASRSQATNTGPAQQTVGPYDSSVANVADPGVQPQTNKQPSSGDETGPAPSTAGPHRSDFANIVDPRVQPEPQSLKESAKPADKRENPAAPVTASGPAAAATTTPAVERAGEPTRESETAAQSEPTTASTTAPATGLTNEPSREEHHIGPDIGDENITHPEKDDMNKGGLIGLYNRIRGAHRRREQRVPKPEEYRERASHEAPRTSAGGESARTNERPSADTDYAAASESSFRRGEGDLRNPSDVSSSGLDEEDFDRGRGTTRLNGKDTDAEDDHFEEARDHFDESLAPPPAFAGQAKNESPVRGTRFREEV